MMLDGIMWIGLMFVWAGLVTYTCIYLGVHFPEDILAGIVLGLFCGGIGILVSHYFSAWLQGARKALTN